MNVIHGSDLPERGLQEVDLFFASTELIDWTSATESWTVEE